MAHSLPTDVVDTGFGLTQTFDLSNRESEREREWMSERVIERERESERILRERKRGN